MHLKQDYQFRTIWDVIGKVRGTSSPDEWVVAGNHRDAWVLWSGRSQQRHGGHAGVGARLGRTAEVRVEAEAHDCDWQLGRGRRRPDRFHRVGRRSCPRTGNAAAYFNMDVAVAGKKFGASGVPSLKEFIREIAKAVPSPQGGTVYDAWKKSSQPSADGVHPQETSTFRPPPAAPHSDVPVGDLGSGSDYTVFLQHLGVPSTDVSSSATTACITRSSTTLPGSRSSAIPIFVTSSRWPASTDWK
jgi:N-acetylated-alpha-linked acidic dipeptidase